MISILVAEDHALSRESLVALLRDEPDVDAVDEADAGDLAWELVRRRDPDVVVLDIGIPVIDGIELGTRIRRHCPGIRLVYLTMHEDDATIRAVMRLRSEGYLLKTDPTQRILEGIADVARGGRSISPRIQDRLSVRPAEWVTRPATATARDPLTLVLDLVDEENGGGVTPSPARLQELRDAWERRDHELRRLREPFEALSTREAKVLEGLIQGRAAETIAADAYVSLATVRTQIRSILLKLGVNSQLAAVALARQASWPPDAATERGGSSVVVVGKHA